MKLLTNPFYWIFVTTFLIIVIVIKLFESKIIGWFGELWTKKELNKLPKSKYISINNILISIDNVTHQIDHIVVSKYGIFVIETKQYNGYITGNKYDKKWVRHIGKKKYYYTNPIRQNYGHMKAVSKLLNIDESLIYNIVSIPSKAIVKVKDDGEVVRIGTIKDKILSYKEEKLENVNDIVDIINKSNITDKKIIKKHIENIKTNIIDNDPNKCPKCGGKLVKRNSKYGEFIGCSNYPKCKYTK